jgi:hypothetical protein
VTEFKRNKMHLMVYRIDRCIRTIKMASLWWYDLNIPFKTKNMGGTVVQTVKVPNQQRETKAWPWEHPRSQILTSQLKSEVNLLKEAQKLACGSSNKRTGLHTTPKPSLTSPFHNQSTLPSSENRPAIM